MNSNNVKRFFGYLLYTILIGFMLFKGAEYEWQLQHLVAQTYKPLPYITYKMIYPIVLGFLMGLPKLINNCYKNGIWYFDWIKFIAIGIPALLIISIPFVYVLPFLNHSNLTRLPSILLYLSGHSLLPETVSGIAFGYLISLVIDKHPSD